jgi:hypothetical protein
MNHDEELYYRRRLFEEETAIRRATCLAARDRHEELASAYRLRLRYAGAPHPFIASTRGLTAEPAQDDNTRSSGINDTRALQMPMPLATEKR